MKTYWHSVSFFPQQTHICLTLFNFSNQNRSIFFFQKLMELFQVNFELARLSGATLDNAVATEMYVTGLGLALVNGEGPFKRKDDKQQPTTNKQQITTTTETLKENNQNTNIQKTFHFMKLCFYFSRWLDEGNAFWLSRACKHVTPHFLPGEWHHEDGCEEYRRSGFYRYLLPTGPDQLFMSDGQRHQSHDQSVDTRVLGLPWIGSWTTTNVGGKQPQPKNPRVKENKAWPNMCFSCQFSVDWNIFRP